MRPGVLTPALDSEGNKCRMYHLHGAAEINIHQTKCTQNYMNEVKKGLLDVTGVYQISYTAAGLLKFDGDTVHPLCA